MWRAMKIFGLTLLLSCLLAPVYDAVFETRPSWGVIIVAALLGLVLAITGYVKDKNSRHRI